MKNSQDPQDDAFSMPGSQSISMADDLHHSNPTSGQAGIKWPCCSGMQSVKTRKCRGNNKMEDVYIRFCNASDNNLTHGSGT